MLGEMKTHAYIQRSIDDTYVIFILYVDYMLITGKNKDKLYKLKENLSQTLDIKIWEMQNTSLECVLIGIRATNVIICLNLSMYAKFSRSLIWRVQSL